MSVASGKKQFCSRLAYFSSIILLDGTVHDSTNNVRNIFFFFVQ